MATKAPGAAPQAHDIPDAPRHLTVVAHPLLKMHLSRIRDKRTPSAAFREALDAASMLVLVEALADLELTSLRIDTPLEETEGYRLSKPLVLVPILRAGLGMLGAALRLVPEAVVWHLGLYRDEVSLAPVSYYDRIPAASLSGATVLVLDPMLATAGSAVAALTLLAAKGATDMRLAALVAAPEGLAHLAARHPLCPIKVAAVDDRLSTSGDAWPAGYIMPGLGDAGDRQFGTQA